MPFPNLNASAVLHHVLLALMGEDADPTLLAFLRVDEMLVSYRG